MGDSLGKIGVVDTQGQNMMDGGLIVRSVVNEVFSEEFWPQESTKIGWKL